MNETLTEFVGQFQTELKKFTGLIQFKCSTEDNYLVFDLAFMEPIKGVPKVFYSKPAIGCEVVESTYKAAWKGFNKKYLDLHFTDLEEIENGEEV